MVNVSNEWSSEAWRTVEGIPAGYDIAHMLDQVGRVSPGKPVLIFAHLYLKSEETVKTLVKTLARLDPLSVQGSNSWCPPPNVFNFFPVVILLSIHVVSCSSQMRKAFIYPLQIIWGRKTDHLLRRPARNHFSHFCNCCPVHSPSLSHPPPLLFSYRLPSDGPQALGPSTAPGSCCLTNWWIWIATP